MNLDYVGNGQEASFEKDHWWVRSRFGLIDRILQRIDTATPLAILEIGCGTGVNMDYLETHFSGRIGSLLGVDPDAVPVQSGKRTVQREAPSGKSFDLILAMDVLEHVEDPIEFLKRLRAQLKPSGALLVTVPAFQWLWSAFDDVAHHRTRYVRRQLCSELGLANFKVDESFYLYGLLFPLFVIQRLSLRLRPARDARLFKPVNPRLNRWLYALTAWEMRTWMARNRSFGSSVVAFARAE